MEKLKCFSVRLPRDIWLFLKERSAMDERSMADIINETLRKVMVANEKKLAKNDTKI
jgi:hypothetical protein